MNELKRAVKEEVQDVKKDIKDGIKIIKKNVKEGTESIKENVKDAERAIKEGTEIITRDDKDLKEAADFIQESVKILVTALGELDFVGLCFTLNVLMNPGSHGNRRRQSVMSS